MADPAKASAGQSGLTAAAAKKTQYPLKVKVATGKKFTFTKAPVKIASVSPAETETLFAIDLVTALSGYRIMTTTRRKRNRSRSSAASSSPIRRR